MAKTFASPSRTCFRAGALAAAALAITGSPQIARGDVAADSSTIPAALHALEDLHLRVWSVASEGGRGIRLSTTISGWKPGEHCLAALPAHAMDPVERELEALLVQLGSPDNTLMWFTIEGTSDDLKIDDPKRFRDLRCAELTFDLSPVVGVRSADGRLALARDASVWTRLAKVWNATHASDLGMRVLAPGAAHGAAILFARQEQARGPSARRVEVTLHVRVIPAVQARAAPRELPSTPGPAASLLEHAPAPTTLQRTVESDAASPRTSVHARLAIARALGDDHYAVDLGATRTIGARLEVGGRLGLLRGDRMYQIVSGLTSTVVPRAQGIIGIRFETGPVQIGVRATPGLLLPTSGLVLDGELVVGITLAARLTLAASMGAGVVRTHDAWWRDFEGGVGFSWSFDGGSLP
jgi:hypothetical protein